MPDYEICSDCGHAKIECVFHTCMCDDVEARIAELEQERDTYESAATKALNARDKLREALQIIFNLPEEQPHLDGGDWYDEAQVIAKQALAGKESE